MNRRLWPIVLLVFSTFMFAHLGAASEKPTYRNFLARSKLPASGPVSSRSDTKQLSRMPGVRMFLGSTTVKLRASSDGVTAYSGWSRISKGRPAAGVTKGMPQRMWIERAKPRPSKLDQPPGAVLLARRPALDRAQWSAAKLSERPSRAGDGGLVRTSIFRPPGAKK